MKAVAIHMSECFTGVTAILIRLVQRSSRSYKLEPEKGLAKREKA